MNLFKYLVPVFLIKKVYKPTQPATSHNKLTNEQQDALEDAKDDAEMDKE